MEYKTCIYETPDEIYPNGFTLERGFANGYVMVPAGHPLHGKNYDDVHVSVHGGLTYSGDGNNLRASFGEMIENGWVFGFDTAHAGDNKKTCNKEYVERELNNLLVQLKTYE